MSNTSGLNILRAKLSPTGQQRLFEFLDAVDTDSAARFRNWLSSAPDTEVNGAADLINRSSHGREFAGWWRSHDRVQATAATRVQPRGRSPLEQLHSQARARAANRDLTVGGVWLVIGIFVTIGSYSLAASTGASYFVIASGTILYGALRLFRGLRTR